MKKINGRKYATDFLVVGWKYYYYVYCSKNKCLNINKGLHDISTLVLAMVENNVLNFQCEAEMETRKSYSKKRVRLSK